MKELNSTEHEYSDLIADAIREYLDNDDWHYKFDDELGVFNAGIAVGSKIQHVQLNIQVGEKDFTCYFKLPLAATKEVRRKVVEYITRANYGLKNGNFELDYNDGEIRYKTFVPVLDDAAPSEELIRFSIFVGVAMVSRYSDGIAEVIFNIKEPLEAIVEAESPKEYNDIDDDIDDDDDIEDEVDEEIDEDIDDDIDEDVDEEVDEEEEDK